MAEIKIIDNCIPVKQQDLIIKELLQNKYFPWFYREDVTACLLYTSPSPRD